MQTTEKNSEPVFENLDDVMQDSSFDEDNSVDNFYDDLDEGIDSYFENLRKKEAAPAKLPYQPPLIEVYEYAVEHGFAQSPPATTRYEEFSEINGEGNENERGIWDVEW